MLEIKRLAACTLDEVLKAWNTGFEGYYFDMTMAHEAFLKRFVTDDLSARMSIVAFVDNEPAGLILSGTRTIQGVRTAWNGGTAVAVKYRGQGVGTALMKEALGIYEQEEIRLAMLEAIEGNEKAIALYKSFGYKIIDELEHLAFNGKLAENPIENGNKYSVRKVPAVHISHLPFYKADNPWQTHWQNAKDAEAVILLDEDGTEAGYAYFRKTYDTSGKHIATAIYQCEADENRNDCREIVLALISHIFGSFGDDIRRIVINLPIAKSGLTSSVFKEIGFSPTVRLVMMKRNMDEKVDGREQSGICHTEA